MTSLTSSFGTATITIVRAAGSTEPVAVYWSTAGTATPQDISGGFRLIGNADYVGIWENGNAGSRGMVRFDTN